MDITKNPPGANSITNGEARRISEVFNDARILINADDSALKVNFRELWDYRELLYFLVWRDIKIRYKQTLLGATWAVIQPLFAMLLFTLFFGKLARIPSDGMPYPLFAYAGLVPWTFFANAVTNSSNSLIGSSSLISKVYFPRIFIPAAAVIAGLLDLAIASALLLPLLIYYKTQITLQILLLPAPLFLLTVLALGVGMWLSALNVRYRDIRYALPFLVQLWLFASPVIYPTSIVPQKWRWILALNPMTGIIESVRAALFGKTLPATLLLLAAIGATLIMVASFLAFRRAEDSFADVV